jgi:hypothetical protein
MNTVVFSGIAPNACLSSCALKGESACAGGSKPALLETGASIQVSLAAS